MTMGRGGWVKYARIIRLLVDRPRTAPEIAAAMDADLDRMQDTMRKMLWLGLVHIGGAASVAKGPVAAVWHPWEGTSVEVPAWRNRAMPYYAPMRPNAELIAFASLISALRKDEHTERTLAEETGLYRTRVRAFLAAMRDELNMVYVSRWERRLCGHGKPSAWYRLGAKPHASRPRAKTKAECERARHLRKAALREHLRMIHATAANASVFNQAA